MKIDDLMRKRGIDYLLFFSFDSSRSSAGMMYFSGYSGSGVMLKPIGKRPFFILPEMEFARVKGFRKYKSKEILKKTKEFLAGKNIGIDYSAVTVKDFNAVKKVLKGKFFDISDDLKNLRIVKKKGEIDKVKKACQITDMILNRCFQSFKKFSKESDVKDFLLSSMRKLGVEPSFDPIVASGSGSSVPHYEGAGRLRKGFCIIDFGVKFEGYCSDMTRTVYLGKPSKKEIDDYNFILEIQKKAIDMIKPGIKIGNLAKDIRMEFGEKEKFFIHSLGHGVGLDIHEAPSLGIKSKDIFKAGMTVAVEPGIYYPNRYGIRIEDTVLVGKVPEVLTKTSKRLISF